MNQKTSNHHTQPPQHKLPKAEAQDWAYAELERRYPPLQNGNPDGNLNGNLGDATTSGSSGAAEVPDDRPRTRGDSLQGLNEIPADWPQLPANSGIA